MAKDSCPDCKAWNFRMPVDIEDLVFDYQTKLRGEKKKLNKYQVLWKMIKEWKEKNGG